MNHRFHRMLIVFSMVFLLAPCAYAQGNISGRARLSLEDGSTACADWVRVLLVRSEAEVPKCPDLNHMGKFERMEMLRNLHMIFFVNVREKTADPDYIVRSTLTAPDGTFLFPDIPPGSYYILVTFPAMIRDYKVAWQAPVAVTHHETLSLELNNANLVIPTYSRYED